VYRDSYDMVYRRIWVDWSFMGAIGYNAKCV